MGMAASQARYLGLTARKTNTEYEGQQINQQRTALANQSAGLFNQLMSLNPPVPPSTDQFTSVKYTYSPDGVNTETLTNKVPLAGNADFNYTVTHTHTESVYKGIKQIQTNPQVQYIATPAPATYWINGLKTYAYDATKDAEAVAQISKDNPTSSIATAYNGGLTANLFSYKSGGKTLYASKADMDASIASSAVPPVTYPLTGQPPLNLYYAASLATEVTTTEKAYIETDSAGRMTSIELESTPDTTFALKTGTTTDTSAYNDAMNQYTFNTQVYDKKIEDINAKTAVIQQEDRTLELRLKQLDTEQEALQTEMESVKKVIDKNIETTFKTFS